MSVAYSEMKGSPVERGTFSEFSATMTLLCDWGDRHALMREWVGRMRGYPHAISGNVPAVPAISANARPFGGELGTGETVLGTDGQLGIYEKAMVTIEFGTLKIGSLELTQAIPGRDVSWRVIAEAFTEDFQPISEFQTLPHEGFQWSDGEELKPDEAPGKQTVGFDYRLTRHFLFGDNIAPLMGLVDTVNDRPLIGVTPLLRGLYFAPETMLFRVPTVHTRAISMYSISYIEFTMNMSYRRAGWNTFWRPDKVSYELDPSGISRATGVGDYDTIHVAPESGEDPPGKRYRNFRLANFLEL